MRRRHCQCAIPACCTSFVVLPRMLGSHFNKTDTTTTGKFKPTHPSNHIHLDQPTKHIWRSVGRAFIVVVIAHHNPLTPNTPGCRLAPCHNVRDQNAQISCPYACAFGPRLGAQKKDTTDPTQGWESCLFCKTIVIELVLRLLQFHGVCDDNVLPNQTRCEKGTGTLNGQNVEMGRPHMKMGHL